MSVFSSFYVFHVEIGACRPAALAELLEDASQPALRIGLLRLDDLLHIVQSILLQQEQVFMDKFTTLQPHFSHTHQVTGGGQDLPVYLQCCL